jgi:hypothetical protein
MRKGLRQAIPISYINTSINYKNPSYFPLFKEEEHVRKKQFTEHRIIKLLKQIESRLSVQDVFRE